MNIDDLHSFLRKKTIQICELPEEDVIELDNEISEAKENKDVV
jgi:hypothetical protein